MNISGKAWIAQYALTLAAGLIQLKCAQILVKKNLIFLFLDQSL